MANTQGKKNKPSQKPYGRMRNLNRPDQRPPNRRYYNKNDKNFDKITKRRIRDDRIFGALCHVGIFLGIWGIVTTGVIWAFRKDRSRIIRFQGAQALLYQLTFQLLFFAIFALFFSMKFIDTGESGFFSIRIPPIINGLGASYFFSCLFSSEVVLQILAVAWVLFGFVAAFFLFLCFLGLEPSYPVIGLMTRKILNLKTSQPAEIKEKKGNDINRQKAEKKE